MRVVRLPNQDYKPPAATNDRSITDGAADPRATADYLILNRTGNLGERIV
jgi:hypothetical protein